MRRSYEETHPWINFELNLNRFTYDTWMLLGEARSKCAHLAGVPLKPKVAEHLCNVYLAKGVQATVAIEGNTLTEKEVQQAIEGTLDVGKSKEYLETEVLNILEAANAITDEIETIGPQPVSEQQIKSYNRTVLSGLSVGTHVTPGEYSPVVVGVPAYKGTDPSDHEFLVNKLAAWLNSADFSDHFDPVVAGILKACIVHLYVAWIHPFGDGNGRTARLLEIRLLMEAGVPMPACQLLSNHYNITRSEYYRRLDLASKRRDPHCFVSYAVQGFVDQLREQLKIVKDFQWHSLWQNFVHESFGHDRTRASERQLRLMLELGGRTNVVTRAELTELSPRIAKLYAGKQERTVSRDLKELRKRGLIVQTRAGIRARREIMYAFLPRARKGDREAQVAELLPEVLKVGDDEQADLFAEFLA